MCRRTSALEWTPARRSVYILAVSGPAPLPAVVRPKTMPTPNIMQKTLLDAATFH